MVSDELERRAAQGAQVHAGQVEARKREFSAPPVVPELNALAKWSLIEGVKIQGFPPDAVVVLVTLLIVVGACVYLRDDVKLAAVVGSSIVIVGGLGAFIAALFRWARQLRWALAWFETLPFALDRRKYLEHLGESRTLTFVKVQVTFTGTPSPQEMEMFANAASGSAAIGHREWRDNLLWLVSVELKTYAYTPGVTKGSGSSNHKAHAWMLSVTDGALRLIHERQPIKRVEVKMESSPYLD